MLLATHDGSFHADETTACAILTYLYEDAEILRSRDPDELEKADLIFDVSGINDDKHFDHHSPAFTLKRASGAAYATAGLMWLKFGREFLSKAALKHNLGEIAKPVLEAAFERLDKEIMLAVDLNDNGQTNDFLEKTIPTANPGEKAVFEKLNAFYMQDPAIPYLVAMMNYPNADPAFQYQNFMKVVSILRTLLEGAAVNALTTEAGIAKVLEAYDGSELLILNENLPWQAAVRGHFADFKNCRLAIYPDKKRGWRIQSLPYSPSNRFKNKLPAPKAWCGLNFEELDKATGLTGTIFVHRSGFTGGAFDYETTLKMAKLWLQLGEAVQDDLS